MSVTQNDAVIQNNNTRAGACPAPTIETVIIGNIIGAYKSQVSNEILKLYKIRNKYMGKLWKRNYYEHIIRSEIELNKIREYILYNPIN